MKGARKAENVLARRRKPEVSLGGALGIGMRYSALYTKQRRRADGRRGQRLRAKTGRRRKKHKVLKEQKTHLVIVATPKCRRARGRCAKVAEGGEEDDKRSTERKGGLVEEEKGTRRAGFAGVFVFLLWFSVFGPV
ncbi:uncharacterized protein SPSK_04653 [Sporothrix schenckii 1099-18]|uniref:Transmembrane protein n=1 Tax=Sporothrix schenckii 1099-18 TaxID=1397361 RepID=A0A0F2M5E8_SPOSC|nr:uncharacterized protein SPSK_04653 [Sporothrix schenckii 1099-18]KJR83416.1 hypothetical protein SPSK_04653 [Sporothrix schenckii 1099-18]